MLWSWAVEQGHRAQAEPGMQGEQSLSAYSKAFRGLEEQLEGDLERPSGQVLKGLCTL